MIASTPGAMRNFYLRRLCYFDLKSNVEKSKCMIVSSRQWRHLPSVCDPNVIQFYLDGKSLEYVKSCTHLGHVIVHNLNDSHDIVYHRRCLIGQINSVLCFLAVLAQLLKRVCWNHTVIVYMATSSGSLITAAMNISMLHEGTVYGVL